MANRADFIIAPQDPADGRMMVVESARSYQEAWAIASGPAGAFHPTERQDLRVERVGTAAKLAGGTTTA